MPRWPLLTSLTATVLALTGCLPVPVSQGKVDTPFVGIQARAYADTSDSTGTKTRDESANSPAADAKKGESSRPLVIAQTTSSPAQAAYASTAFAFDLYAQLRRHPGNLFFSPYSISTALAMTSAGARGKTLEEMSRGLYLPSQNDLHPSMSALRTQLTKQAAGKVELATANALWIQKDLALRPEFIALSQAHYQAGVHEVDFAHDPEAARRNINDWTAQTTRKRVQSVMPPGVLNDLSRLVLTNAIYFRGKWDRAFDRAASRERDFHLADGTTARALFMSQTEQLAYADLEQLQILELPYSGGDFSLMVLLPRRKRKLSEIEASMAKSFTAWVARLEVREVTVSIPRFDQAAELSLKDTLTAMGMGSAFTGRADFAGLSDSKEPLKLDQVLHKASVQVNEEGSEAAATTAVVAASLSLPARVAGSPTFTADQPFVYLIRDRRTGSILFMGRMTKP